METLRSIKICSSYEGDEISSCVLNSEKTILALARSDASKIAVIDLVRAKYRNVEVTGRSLKLVGFTTRSTIIVTQTIRGPEENPVHLWEVCSLKRHSTCRIVSPFWVPDSSYVYVADDAIVVRGYSDELAFDGTAWRLRPRESPAPAPAPKMRVLGRGTHGYCEGNIVVDDCSVTIYRDKLHGCRKAWIVACVLMHTL